MLIYKYALKEINFRAATTSQLMGWPWYLSETLLPYLFTSIVGNYIAIFWSINIFFPQKPIIPQGQFKNHLYNSDWVGVGGYFFRVGCPEIILSLQPWTWYCQYIANCFISFLFSLTHTSWWCHSQLEHPAELPSLHFALHSSKSWENHAIWHPTVHGKWPQPPESLVQQRLSLLHIEVHWSRCSAYWNAEKWFGWSSS